MSLPAGASPCSTNGRASFALTSVVQVTVGMVGVMARTQRADGVLAVTVAVVAGLATRATAVVVCGSALSNATCPDGNTCCPTPGGSYGCCADEIEGAGVSRKRVWLCALATQVPWLLVPSE